MKLGFACIWDANPRPTWSYTPWDLRAALRRRSDVEVVDIGFTVPKLLKRVLQLASLKRREGRWITPWKFMRAWEAAMEYELNRRAAALRCDAVLQIQDLAAISTPYLVYQDFSYDVILDCLKQESQALRQYFPHLDAKTALQRRARQLHVYQRAARLLTMSEFLRHSLIERTGMDPGKVATVLPGVSTSNVSGLEATNNPPGHASQRRRLLFAGTSFVVKGGDLVLDALAILRKRHADMRLTIVGPSSWPLPGAIPDGVSFLGRLDPERLSRIYSEHDLMVLPSRLEGFGKVFVEALSHGLPCIGRRAFAMPELIQSGINGDLVESDNPEELAARISAVLDNEAIYRHCESARHGMLAQYNWDRAADEVVKAAITAVSGVDSRQ